MLPNQRSSAVGCSCLDGQQNLVRARWEMYEKNCVIILCQLKWDWLSTQERVEGAFWNQRCGTGRWQRGLRRGWPWPARVLSLRCSANILSMTPSFPEALRSTNRCSQSTCFAPGPAPKPPCLPFLQLSPEPFGRKRIAPS